MVEKTMSRRIKNYLKILLTILYLAGVHIVAYDSLLNRVDAWVLQRYGLDYGTAKASVYLDKASLNAMLKELETD